MQGIAKLDWTRMLGFEQILGPALDDAQRDEAGHEGWRQGWHQAWREIRPQELIPPFGKETFNGDWIKARLVADARVRANR